MNEEARELAGPILSALAREIYDIAQEKGFGPSEYILASQEATDYWIGTKVALAHGELTEFLEEIRMPEVDVKKAEEELADAIIRILHLAHVFEDMDIGRAIVNKIQKNRNRPVKHGKRF